MFDFAKFIDTLMDFYGVWWWMAIIFILIAVALIIMLFVHDSKRDKRMTIHEQFQDEIYAELEKYKKVNKEMLAELRGCIAIIELLLKELKKKRKR